MKKNNPTLLDLDEEYEKTSEEASKAAEKFGAEKFITAVALLDRQMRKFNTTVNAIRDEINDLRDVKAHEMRMKEKELEAKKLESGVEEKKLELEAKKLELEAKKLEGVEAKKPDSDPEAKKLELEVKKLELLSGGRHEGGDVLDEIKKLNVCIDGMSSKFEELESKIATGGEVEIKKSEEWLSPRDQEIINYIRRQGRASAEEIKNKFNYKRTNAATNRMNNLYRQNILEKQRVGRLMYFTIPCKNGE